MKRDLAVWQFAGFSFTVLGGTLLHFLYDLTGQNILVAPFSAVNESTFEHMKLLYFPLFIYALIQSHFFGKYKNFWSIKLVGTITGLVLIPVLFYTYNGVIGVSPDWVNIAIFFIAVATVFVLEYALLKKEAFPDKSGKLAFVFLCIIGVVFVVFTFYTPGIAIFEDPVTGKYGLSA